MHRDAKKAKGREENDDDHDEEEHINMSEGDVVVHHSGKKFVNEKKDI